MSSMKIENIIKKIQENKKLRVGLIIILISIIFLIVFSDNFFNKKQSETANDVQGYVINLENELRDILSKVEGAGKVDVMISIESGKETVLASNVTKKEISSGTEIIETPILVNGKTVVLKEKYPKVQGVVIVCEGAKKIAVVNSIVNATTSLLNIDNEKIQVIKMK